MHRFEVNVRTGVRTEIEQKAYQNEDGEILVIDVGETIPDGFKEFSPEVDEEV